MTAARGVLFLGALVLAFVSGCAAVKPGCQVIHLADFACTTLVAADGRTVSVTRSDAETPEKLAGAVGQPVGGCGSRGK